MMYSLAIVILLSSIIGNPVFAQNPCDGLPQVIITGEVVAVKHPIALVRDSYGNIYHVRLGPYWFWKKQGFYLKVGEHVRIVAIQKGLLLFPIVISSQDFGVFRIRNECGEPLWRTER
ncbi:hypothetical protein Thein_0673 [Thermodesulfatator indicus DSM 15286]|uniref:Magnetosome protein MamS/MamX domain-containing protein n=1 Tax=Thermodesulfatator indicus (strain DSM 15286 / JCM 11887 / CIR29812) TaxID=667014 RepID=F8A894_THEID|nr:hypothetical protein [Thermodesulfatator indicus]AEH44553.1 hypothetical protein Thein_0673 [Thermodesulfatator indicus DSM 15286]